MIEQVAICDEFIEDEREINFMVNKIGGLPKFLPQKVFEFKPCVNCNSQMVLVSQLYCPLVNSIYNRVFYVMTCVNQSCWNKSNSWQVYRSQYPDFEYIQSLEATKKETEIKTSTFINKEWGQEASDWDVDDDDDDKKANNDAFKIDTSKLYPDESKTKAVIDEQFDAALEKLDNLDISSSENSSIIDAEPVYTAEQTQEMNDTIKEMFNNWKLNLVSNQSSNKTDDNNNNNTVQFGYFKSYYLNVMNKSIFIDYDKKSPKICLDDFKDVSIDNDKSITKSEEYEESSLKHGDKIFYKFRKAIDYCPYQVVRYARGLNPFFITTHDDLDSDHIKCSYCGAKCNFEFQLMPALVNYLKSINNNNSIEFGVVIVYTCSNSCWNDNDLFRLEHVYVQPDPDEKLFK